MYIAVYLRYHISLLVNINISYMTPQRATWKNSYYMLNVLPSLNKVLLLLLLLLLYVSKGKRFRKSPDYQKFLSFSGKIESLSGKINSETRPIVR